MIRKLKVGATVGQPLQLQRIANLLVVDVTGHCWNSL